MAKSDKVVLDIGDLHAPFMHKDAAAFLYAVKRRYQPDLVVLKGDEVDQHAMSYHEHDPDGMSSGQELIAAIKQLQPIYEMFPKAMVCESNHTSLVYRKAYTHGISRAYLKDYRDFLQAPKGWQWAEHWEVEGVIHEHGTGLSGKNGALTAAMLNMQSTSIGHLHAFAGIQWHANPKHLIFGMNVGCLIDKDAYCFAYGKTNKNKPVIGVGVHVRGIPAFVPMVLNSKGFWVGKL